MANILMVNTYCGVKGGVEKYILQATKLLADNNKVYGLFGFELDGAEKYRKSFTETFEYGNRSIPEVIGEIESKNIDVVIVHKLEDRKLFSSLNKCFYTMLVVHDHDYYCLRRHKYFPFSRKNCSRSFNLVCCSLCSMLIQKGKNGLEIINPLKQAMVLKEAVKCDRFLVLSEFMKSNLLKNGFPADKIEKVYPYVPAPTEDIQAKPECGNILYVGQVIRGKGVDLLIKALSLVKNDYRLNIAGMGNDVDSIKELTVACGISDKVDFSGYSSDIDKVYQQSDLVIVPSRWQEPFGLVGIEAMANGVPVIGFDVGGIEEWLKDGVNGFLISEQDVSMMAEKIDLLLSDRKLRDEMGHNGRRMIFDHYLESRYTEKMKQLLEEIVSV